VGNWLKSVWVFLTKTKEDEPFIAAAERGFSLQQRQAERRV